jgi:3D (Asp-Asp-Asp) domain-containing protein
MRIFNLIIALVLLSCAPVTAPLAKISAAYKHTDIPNCAQEYTARITYYSTDGRWGNKVSCQKTRYAKEGITVAAHPNFKFGTKLYIPGLKGKIGNGNFIVQDRGGAVTSKKASRGKAYVFDIYVTSHSKIRKFAYSQPEYMKVYAVKP